MDSGDAAADDQRVRVDRNLPLLQRLVECHPPHGGRTRSLAFSVALLVQVNPGDVLTDVHHLHEEGVDASARDGAPEGGLVEVRRTSRHHDPIQPMLGNISLDQLLAWVRAHVLVLTRDYHVGQALAAYSARAFTSTVPGDIRAAVADVDTDPYSVGT